ncbi:hypothetical protein FCJ61_14715 [Burkholderia metallica]|uniref:hypothetical protein n=1 Tax=Burkholderia metallica TaxID=488729 RepID=UPI00157A4644|nr:hypothetical protein [Burkholderia metallica]NTZ84217.1 hypothetical protein [Burkholderia metallica]
MKHSLKIATCWKSLCGNGLRHILHAVSRKMSAAALGNGGVCFFGAPALKIGAVAAELFSLIRDLWFLIRFAMDVAEERRCAGGSVHH